MPESISPHGVRMNSERFSNALPQNDACSTKTPSLGQQASGSAVQFRVLGPLRVSANGQELQLGGRKQRSVLVLLLAGANRPVSIDRIIDGVCSTKTPAGCFASTYSTSTLSSSLPTVASPAPSDAECQTYLHLDACPIG